MDILHVNAHWDPEARVWWAQSDEVPGLVAETKTHEGLIIELRALVPALLAMNRPEMKGGVSLRIVSEQVEEVRFT